MGKLVSTVGTYLFIVVAICIILPIMETFQILKKITNFFKRSINKLKRK